MKHLPITLILTIMFLACNTSKRAYDAKGKHTTAEAEHYAVKFTAPVVAVEKTGAESALVGTVLTAVTNFGFNYLDSLLKGRVKLFSSEFSAHQVYAEQKGRDIPSFTVTRTLEVGAEKHLLQLTFVVKELGSKLGTYYFELDSVRLDRSRALAKNGDRLDYTIELKPIFRVKEEAKIKKETVELKPLQLSSIPFGTTDLTARKIRTEAFLAPNGGIFLELDVKVSETNPRRVKLETVVALWTKSQEEVKKVVLSVIPKDDEGGDPEEEAGN